MLTKRSAASGDENGHDRDRVTITTNLSYSDVIKGNRDIRDHHIYFTYCSFTSLSTCLYLRSCVYSNNVRF